MGCIRISITPKSVWFLLLSIFLIEFSDVMGQVDTGQSSAIRGTVRVIKDTTLRFFTPPKSVEGKPQVLPGTLIKIFKPDSTYITSSTVSYASGTFNIDGLEAGNYIIEAFYIGYESVRKRVHLSKGEVKEVAITMGYIYDPELLPFGAEEARKDIAGGNVEIRDLPSVSTWECNTLVNSDTLETKVRQLRQKYGFVQRMIHEDYRYYYENHWERLRQAVIRYNTVVKNHLEAINGPGWEDRYEERIKEICMELYNKKIK